MRRDLPPLNGLRAFEAAARHGSFTGAAEELFVTPAAVSHQVKGLEDFLGIALFRRLPRGLALTDAGRRYRPGLTAGFDLLAGSEAALREKGLAGMLRISVLPSFGHAWLVPRLADFRARYPDILVHVFFEQARTDFNTSDMDVAIRYGRGEYRGLKATRLMGEEVFPVCSPALLNGPKPLRELADLRHHVLIEDCAALREEPSLTWKPWLAEAGLEQGDVAGWVGFSDSTATARVAVAGQGVALGRSALVAEHLRAGRLVRPFDRVVPADFSYFVVAPDSVAEEPKVAVFRAWAHAQATPGPHAPAHGEAPRHLDGGLTTM